MLPLFKHRHRSKAMFCGARWPERQSVQIPYELHCLQHLVLPVLLLSGRMGLACAWAVLAVIFIGLWVLCLCIEECFAM